MPVEAPAPFRLVTPLLVAAATFVLGAALQPAVIAWMTRRGTVDVPNERSSHRTSTPRGGGLAVVVAAVVGLAALPGTGPTLCLPIAGFGALGLAEDLFGVSVRVRLAAQLTLGAATGAALVGGGRIATPSGIVLVALLAGWLAGQVNAFNFMDGVNGIAAAHTVVAGALFGLIGLIRHLPTLSYGGLIVAAAALSFLPFNAGNAKIFLGDVGSYGLGAALAALAGAAALSGVPIEVAVAPLAVGLADTGWTLLRRVLAGERWYQAHRSHVYQRLTDVGWSHTRVAFATAGLAGLLGLGVLAGMSGTTAVRLCADAVAVLLLVAYVRLPGWLGGRQAFGAAR
jgi:UDP-N-acetylmuramyl pentapeptide phosphotransferase/UDP-N-acetylglucosamine-1-phosphate transferase